MRETNGRQFAREMAGAGRRRDPGSKLCATRRSSGRADWLPLLPPMPPILYIVLTARGLNPKLKIIARASEDAAEKHLLTAGANSWSRPTHLPDIESRNPSAPACSRAFWTLPQRTWAWIWKSRSSDHAGIDVCREDAGEFAHPPGAAESSCWPSSAATPCASIQRLTTN